MESTWKPGARTADAVILTAIRLEFDAVLQVDDGAVPGTAWELETGPSGLPVAFRPFVGQGGRPLRVAVAVAPAMGATAAVNTLLPLVEALRPRCIAMCGVCAGRRGKTRLGDVIAADRLYYHDTGKQLPDEVQQDLTTYNLRDDWKAALEGLDVVEHFRDAAWFQARPVTTEWREHSALVALRDRAPAPWNAIDPTLGEHEWERIVGALRERKLLAEAGRELTDEGRRFVDDLLFKYRDKMPDLSPSGRAEPFRLHVAPMGTGTRVIEDERVWSFVTQAMRKTLGLEMESAALGEVAHRQRQHQLDAVVMKGVMDHADHGRDDHFKEFAARAAAECLLWFLRERVATEVAAGFDDLLTPGTVPLPRRDAAPSLLLNARYALVPWYETGRSEILADLDSWADEPAHEVAVQLLHGEGGIGKTRLAIEWVRRRRGQHEVAGFLRPNPGDGWLERLCGLGPPVVVVIDYAESRPDLVQLLQRIAAYGAAPGAHRRVRVLLLARGDGDWWRTLQQRDPAIRGLVGDRASVKLWPLAATAAAREAVFVAASMAFAAIRGQGPILRSPVDLSDPLFDRVVYLHMAALAAVERARENAEKANGRSPAKTIASDASLMDEILDHEERFWVREKGDRLGAVLDVSLARRLVAAATLRGGVATESEAVELGMRVKERPWTRDDDKLIALLHYMYEGVDRATYLPGLEPDLLGEGMVLRVAAPSPGAGAPAGDTWIERVVIAGDDEPALIAAFTVLGRASATNPTAARPWIETLLRSELARRAVLALRAGKTVGQRTATSMLGDLLAEALERDGSMSIAEELDREEIPFPTVSLRRVAEWRSRILLARAPDGDDDRAIAERAALLHRQGIDFGELGQHQAALAPTRKAVDLYRMLARRNPDAFQSYLAAGLNNLGNTLSDLGEREAALVVAREAVDLYKRLATRNPEEFQPVLATSLNNLGIMLSEMGEREAALAVTREAVDLLRTLAMHNPEAFQSVLATSLSNLGITLSALGQLKPALAATREAVDRYRILAQRSPDAFRPDLALGLSNLGSRLGALGERNAALVAAREAVDLYRTLTTRNPEVFQRGLASSLNNLSNSLSALGEHETALAAAREAVELDRRLATRNPEAFQPVLANSLNNLGVRLSALRQYEPALAAVREAVALYRTLAMRNPETFQPHLANSLNSLGLRLSALRQYEPALTAVREAVDLDRTMATRSPEAFQPALAKGLINLGDRLTELCRHELALAAVREAIDLYRPLAMRQPDVFQPDLAGSLINLGVILRELGQHELALAATREAVDLYRTLATRNPEAFQPDLAGSLINLGVILRELGQHKPALAAIREAVELRHALGIQDEDNDE